MHCNDDEVSSIDEVEDDQYWGFEGLRFWGTHLRVLQMELAAATDSRAVAEVRNPTHNQEVIHGPDFNNFMSHKPWQ